MFIFFLHDFLRSENSGIQGSFLQFFNFNKLTRLKCLSKEIHHLHDLLFNMYHYNIIYSLTYIIYRHITHTVLTIFQFYKNIYKNVKKSLQKNFIFKTHPLTIFTWNIISFEVKILEFFNFNKPKFQIFIFIKRNSSFYKYVSLKIIC